MESVFAMFPPAGLTFQRPDDTYKYKQYAEFALFKLPPMLEKHSSSRLSDDYKKIVDTRKHKRNSSIVIETAGILMNACRTVSFSNNVETKIYKKNAW